MAKKKKNCLKISLGNFSVLSQNTFGIQDKVNHKYQNFKEKKIR